MKRRIGRECKMRNCKNYIYYSSWYNNLGSTALSECMNCKHAYKSQYVKVGLAPISK